MSQPLDLSQFPDLPPEVVRAFAVQKAALEAAQFEASVERAARQHEQAVVAEKEAFITELKTLIEKLEGQVQDYRRTKFGPKSEKLDPSQLELALEDLETEPPRVCRRVVCSMTKRPYRVCSGLHRTPPLLLRAGCIRWGREGGGCYTNRPI